MARTEAVTGAELDGYILRHEQDPYAHAAMRHDLRSDLTGQMGLLSLEVNRLHDWQQRILGGMMFAALLLGSGGLAFVVEWARGFH